MTDHRRDRQLTWFAIIAGLLTMVIASRFGARPMVYCQGIGEAMPRPALHAFQMARPPEMLTKALGCADCVAMLNAMNHLDLAAFIPVYEALTLFATAVLARGSVGKLAFLLSARVSSPMPSKPLHDYGSVRAGQSCRRQCYRC